MLLDIEKLRAEYDRKVREEEKLGLDNNINENIMKYANVNDYNKNRKLKRGKTQENESIEGNNVVRPNSIWRNVHTSEGRRIQYRRKVLKMTDNEREERTREILRAFGEPRPALNELLNISIDLQPENRIQWKPPRNVKSRKNVRVIKFDKKNPRIGTSLIINGRCQNRIKLQNVSRDRKSVV